MPTDRYTKAVLTVIAAALAILVGQNATHDATAQQPTLACTVSLPCYVTNTVSGPLYVVDPATARTPNDRLRGIPQGSGQPK